MRIEVEHNDSIQRAEVDGYMITLSTFKPCPALIMAVSNHLQSIGMSGSRKLSIAESVCKFCDVTMLEICGRSRYNRIARARIIAYFICRISGYSYKEIGIFFGRDHTTILQTLASFVEDISQQDRDVIRVICLTLEWIKNYEDNWHLLPRAGQSKTLSVTGK